MLFRMRRLHSLAPPGWAAVSDGSAELPSELGLETQLLGKLHTGNLTDLAAARLSIAHGTTATIRQFARDLVRDHSQVDQDLTSLANRRGIALPVAAEDDGVKQRLLATASWWRC